MTGLYHHTSSHGTASMLVVLELVKGDDVSVADVDMNRAIHGDAYTSFSGFLLQEYYNLDTSVLGK